MTERDDLCDNINILDSVFTFHVHSRYFSVHLHEEVYALPQKPRVLSLIEPLHSDDNKRPRDYNSVN